MNEMSGAARMIRQADLPNVCPVCGAYSLDPDGTISALLAVCDVLVVKALEALGKYIVRADRSRFRQLGTRPWSEAHTIWTPDDMMVSKALKSAWDVVPALLDTHGTGGVTSVQVTSMLDDYVHDLAITGTRHTIDELQYRFETYLHMPVYRRKRGGPGLSALAGAAPGAAPAAHGPAPAAQPSSGDE